MPASLHWTGHFFPAKLETAQLIIEHLAKVGITLPKDRWSEYLFSPVLNMHDDELAIKLTNLLLANGADLNYRDRFGNTALFGSFNIKAAMILVEHGADIEARNYSGETPLFYNTKEYETSLGNFLLKNGANPFTTDNLGRTLLHKAVYNPKSPKALSLRKLLNIGINIEARDNRGRTPLYQAAASRFPGAVNELLRLGADIGARDNEGHTPLWAAEIGEYDRPIGEFAAQPLTRQDIEYFNSVGKKNRQVFTQVRICSSLASMF